MPAFEVERVVGDEWTADTGYRRSWRVCKKHGPAEHYWKKHKHYAAGGSWSCLTCTSERAHKAYNRSIQAANESRLIAVGKYILRRGYVNWIYKGYRLRPEDLVMLWEKQGGVCIICNNANDPLIWGKFDIDHIHGYPGCKETGRRSRQEAGCPPEAVRGLAHPFCNKLAGFAVKHKNVMLMAMRHEGVIQC